MNTRVKKAGVVLFILSVTNFIGPSIGSGNINTSGIGVESKQTEGIKLENASPGPDYEGDSIATMTKNSLKKKKLDFKSYDEAFIKNFGYRFSTERYLENRDIIEFGTSNSYSDLRGVTCFRGNNMRDGGSFEEADIKEEKLRVIWKKDIGSIDTWTGVGWNGQPAIVQWDRKTIDLMNIKEEKKNVPDLKEVIYATLDGNVYFLDLDDGKQTREKLNIGAPVKGSLTIDPRGLPIAYIGQGIDWNGPKYMEFAYRIFSLIDFSKLYEIKGRDGFAKRDWGAFDSTALIDKNKDYIFICGENGLVYSGKLNTKLENGKISINPRIDKYEYDAVNRNRKGIENSMAIFENYGFFADNDGLLQCLDLNTLTPVWTQEVNDDTDSTVTLERDKNGLNLYTACEVDHQGNGGYSYVRRIDATSGKIMWEQKYRCFYDMETNGGALATPIVGKNDISNMVIFNIARTPEYNSGYLVAFNKETGKELWKLKLQNYCWSSPIALYSNNGKSYIVQCDSTGKAMLIEGISGRILDTIDLGANVEGSPAAFGNKIVVGTRGSRIIGFEVR